MSRSLPAAAALSLALLAAAGIALTLNDEPDAGDASPTAASSASASGSPRATSDAAPGAGQAAEASAAPVGLVVDGDGEPIAGATVTTAQGTRARTDDQGRFAVSAPGIYSATAPGHLPRAGVGSPTALPRLVLPTKSETVTLRFGGDVMAGRRFYEDQEGRKALLGEDSSAAQHGRLLAGVAPLLRDSDVTVVNLETPLVEDPAFPEDERPSTMHPTKEIAFASSTELAQALADTGVDVVDLANNHSFDALDEGLSSTLEALDEAHVAHTGAGVDEESAWKPAVVTVRGRDVALVSCTTVTGEDEEIPYVAGPNRAGAAGCSPERLTAAVTGARATGADVAVMIHGHVEYEREQVALVRELTEVASAAGASAVMNAHPHVIGGMTTEGGAVVSETMGNLLFDQKVWPTFLSYLVRVDLSADGSASASTDPIVLEDYLPQPATGSLADASARIAAGTVPGAALGETGATVTTSSGTAVDAPGQATTESADLSAGVTRLPAGTWVDKAQGLRVGQDLLWGTGSFEPSDPRGKRLAAPLWTLGSYAKLAGEAACTGAAGVDMLRSPVSTEDVYASTSHRVQVVAGDQVSMLVDVRAATGGATAELRWYDESKGESSSTSTIDIEPRGDDAGCEVVRLDVTVPEGAVAAQPFVRLPPPEGSTSSGHLAVDNIRLVRWAPEGTTGRLYDTVESTSARTVQLGRDG